MDNKMYSIVEFYHTGGCRILQPGINENELTEKEYEVREFNREHVRQNLYRAIMKD